MRLDARVVVIFILLILMVFVKNAILDARIAMDLIIKIVLFAMTVFIIIILLNYVNLVIMVANSVQIIYAKHALWDLILLMVFVLKMILNMRNILQLKRKSIPKLNIRS